MTTSTATLNIDRIPAATLLVKVIGTAPMLQCRFPEKARREICESAQGHKHVKESRDPIAEYEASMHRWAGGYGFPAAGFKKATVSACRFYDRRVAMSTLRQSLFIDGEPSILDGVKLVPIWGEPKMREDFVTQSSGGKTICWRAEFPDWHATLQVLYIESLMSRSSVVSLIEAGGMCVGVGDWRAEKGGDFGTYEVVEVIEQTDEDR